MTDEEFAAIDTWVDERNFWKSSAEDWEEIFSSLKEAGFLKREAFDLVDSILNLAKSEYGE